MRFNVKQFVFLQNKPVHWSEFCFNYEDGDDDNDDDDDDSDPGAYDDDSSKADSLTKKFLCGHS